MRLLFWNFTISSLRMKRQLAPSWLFLATEAWWTAYADTGFNNVYTWKCHLLYLKSSCRQFKKFQYFSGSFLATTTNLFQIDAIIASKIYNRIQNYPNCRTAIVRSQFNHLQGCNCSCVSSFATALYSNFTVTSFLMKRQLALSWLFLATEAW